MNVLVERSGSVTTVIINRPEPRNAVDEETASQLLAAFESFEEDAEAAVAVLAGAGGFFCAGWDLKSMRCSAFSAGAGAYRSSTVAPSACPG